MGEYDDPVRSTMGEADDAVQSPCVRNCCLDERDTCLGCHRSLQEIVEWGMADNARRLVILENARQRRER